MNNISNIYENLNIGGRVTFLLNSEYNFSHVFGDYSFGNPLLSEISFNSLKRIFGNIYLLKNESLENLNFLSSIEDGSYKDLIIWDNDALMDITGLSNFSAVSQSLAIFGNDNLTNLKGLENISIVAWEMLISNNDILESIDMSKLNTVGRIHIENNAKINSLNGLSSLRKIGSGLSIYNNPKLDNFCDLWPLYSYGQINGGTYISNNKYNPSTWSILNGYCSQ